MIADLDETIRQLLLTELEITGGEIDIDFEQPKREWSARLSRPTVNFYLYDVRENVQLRQYGREERARTKGNVTLQRTPLRLDCHYMMTAWANDPSDEHRLLGRAMQVLFRNNPIPEDRLYGRLSSQRFSIQTQLASHDKLTNSAEIWSSLDNEIRPSISYLATLTMEPYEQYDVPAVQTLDTRIARPEGNDLATAVELFTIGGIVRSQARNGAPFAGALVTLRGTGFRSVTDSFGRYRLRNLTAGDHTLIIRPTPDTTIEHTISVPGELGAYDVDV